DPVDIDKVKGRGTGAPDIDAVEIEADALLDAVIGEAERRAKAANIDRRIARVAGDELKRGLELLEPVDVERTGPADLGPADHRQCERNLLRPLLAPPGGHDDIARTRCSGIRGRCLRRGLRNFGNPLRSD